MADIVDAADSVVELWAADAERRARGKSAPETDPSFDGLNCVECGEPIHPTRIAMGKVRCVDCQGRIDLSGRMLGRR